MDLGRANPFFQKYYRCTVFDNRGARMSAKPQEPYSMAGMAADVPGLPERLKIEKALVFALSMGGMIALELARVAPARISAMLPERTHAGGHNCIAPSPEALSLLMDIAGLSREGILRKQTVPVF
jgi:pimeloyl-ACP methyl ester carboxylesterase